MCNKHLTKMPYFLKSFISRLNYGKIEFGSDNLFLASELKSIDNIKNVHLRDNEVLFKYKVHPNSLNYWGAMHGGAISTLIDIASTIAITGMDKNHRKNISIELSTNFLSPVTPENDIFILCKISKIGKNIAYSTIELLDTKSLKVIATASHTKAMLEGKWEIEINDKI